MTDLTDPLLDPEIDRILAHPKQRPFRDLRDRAAYMHLTGTYPSHLRREANHWLRLISRQGQSPSALHASANVRILQRVAQRLNLDAHPMVVKVRAKAKEGYRITVSRGANQRMPYGKIFLSKGGDEITVQIDGSVLDHW